MKSEIKLLIQENSKPQNCIVYTEGSVTQYRVRVVIHCQARCDHYTLRQCSLYGLNLQLDNGGGSSHPCPPLDCLKR